MNIAFVFDDTLDNPDGVQQYIFALSEYLIANKHTVHFLVGETKRTDLKNIYSLSKNIRVKFNGNVVGTPLPASKQKIKSLINELNIDVIHVQMPYSPLLAGRVIKCVSPDTGVIGTFHVFPQSKFEAFLSKALTIVNRTTLKKFDEFIAVSKVAKQASHIKNRNISIIPNPIDLSKYKTSKKLDTVKKIVYLGRLVDRKGCLEFVNAILELIKQDKWEDKWVVEIAGTGPLKNKLEEIIQKSKATKSIKLVGFVDENEKKDFLSNAELAVFPSKAGESFGIVLLEAMASRTAVIAGLNPGYACVLTGELKKQLVNPVNTLDFAKKIHEFMSSNKKREEIVEIQNKHVLEYDINTVGKNILAKYKNALK